MLTMSLNTVQSRELVVGVKLVMFMKIMVGTGICNTLINKITRLHKLVLPYSEESFHTVMTLVQ